MRSARFCRQGVHAGATAALAMLLSTLPLAAAAEIRESTSVAPVDALATPGTLVVFDIDNTLIEPTVTLGSDQWFYWYVAELEAGGRSSREAIDLANDVWNRVQPAIAVRPVEAMTPQLIRGIQARGLRVVALTARSHDAAAVTETQLTSAGYSLSTSAFGPGRRVIGDDPTMVYDDGVLYVGEHASKGDALLRLLAGEGLSPERVVFVDDKEKHVRTVDAALSSSKIPVIAIRYGAADARVAAFDPAVAAVQFRLWSSVLSDEEAARFSRCVTAPPSSRGPQAPGAIP
jgi:hypothetical protein